MPAKRELSMRQLRHLLRLHHDGVSAREIGRRLGVARSTIQDNLKRAAAAGLAWPLADDVTDEALETRLFGRAGVMQGRRRRVNRTGWPGARAQASWRHDDDPLGGIPRGPSRGLRLQPLCCGPAYVSFLYGSLCDQDGCALLTQHKSEPRLASLTHAGVCHGSAMFFRQRRRLPSSRRAIR